MKFIIRRESDGWGKYPKPCENAYIYKEIPKTEHEYALTYWAIDFVSFEDFVKWCNDLDLAIRIYDSVEVIYDGLPIITILDVDYVEEIQKEIEEERAYIF